MIGGVLMGALLGAFAVWTGPGGVRRGTGGDPVIAGTRQVCEAILADEEARWKAVGDRYFAGETPAGRERELLEVARAQAVFFARGSRIVALRRCADGEAGDRRMVAVECRARTPAGDRTITLHWERKRGAPWRPTDLLSAPAQPEAAAAASLPAAANTAAEGKGKPRPQDH
jgi:hypothetical protein